MTAIKPKSKPQVRPIGDALSREYTALIRQLDKKAINPGDAKKRLSKVLEIEGWLFPDTPQSRKARADSLVQLLESVGWPYELIELFERSVRKGKQGAPARKRSIAIAAWEDKLRDPSLSWPKLAAKYCDCRKAPHDSYCKESLRQAVMDLQALLRKYGITPVP